jgi:D-alanine-D-alanine ligase-like ATP-grasp enzyme
VNGRPLVNEVNAIPEFSKRSKFPRLWEAGGLPLPCRVDELIEAALVPYAERAVLKAFLSCK